MSAPAPHARVAVGPLAERDLDGAVDALANAFRDNALNRAVIRSDDPVRRVRSNAHGMRALLPVARRHGIVLAARVGDERVAGVLIATPPYGYPLPPPPLWPRLRCVLGPGWGVAQRWIEVFHALEALYPMEPMWYLGTLGVAPARQGCGVGRALLSRWLEQVDAEGEEAYLETDLPENVPFYEGSGFAVEGETSVLGVEVWRMRRAAHPTPGLQD